VLISREIEAWIKAEPLVCAYTRRRLTLATLQVDHCQPLDRGGTNEFTNLCLAHRNANGAKGSMTEEEFRSPLTIIGAWDDGRGRLFVSGLRASPTVFTKRR